MEEAKLKGIVRLRINGILEPFHFYGLEVHIPPANEALIALMEWYYEERRKAEDDSSVS